MSRIAAAAAALLAAARTLSAQPVSSVDPIFVYWSATHNDNACVATQASIASLDNTYQYYAPNLYVVSNTTQPPGTVPLNIYSNAATNHHMTTASDTGNAWAKANGYTFQRVEGYVYADNADGSMLPLEMWYSAGRGDHFLVGTADNRANAVGAGYVLQYVDSWVPLQWVQWPSVVPPGSPFPASTALQGYEYAYGQAAVPPGIGADTWYPTWTDVSIGGQPLMLSSWTDGSVNGVGSSSADSPGHNATTGIAWVVGSNPFNLTITNASVYTEPAFPYQGRYPSVCQYVDGVWYYGAYSLENWRGNGDNPGPDCGNWCVLGPLTDIRTSTDLGATWTAPHRYMANWSDNLWGEEAVNNSKVVMGAPHAVDFGRNLQYSPDGRMYLVGTGALGPWSYQSWMQGDSVNLARTIARPDPARINDPTFWEFYTGGHGASATWSAPGDVKAAVPLFVWPNRTGVVTASWAPALSKYLMVVSTPTTSPSTVAHFDTYLLEADDLTGPYSLITYMPSYGPQAYFVHWPSLFMPSQAAAVAAGSEARRVAVPAARQEGVDSAGAVLEAAKAAATPEQAAALARLGLQAKLDALTQPMPAPTSTSPSAAPTYWTSYLSYSGNFASGYAPNPPDTGYHWTLQYARLQLTSSYARKLQEQKEQKEGEGMQQL